MTDDLMKMLDDLKAEFTELVESTRDESEKVARDARNEKDRPVDEGELRDLERRVGEYFRSGGAGAIAQGLQDRIDAGESWESLEKDPVVLQNLWGLLDAIQTVYDGGGRGPGGGGGGDDDTDPRMIMKDAW